MILGNRDGLKKKDHLKEFLEKENQQTLMINCNGMYMQLLWVPLMFPLWLSRRMTMFSINRGTQNILDTDQITFPAQTLHRLD